MSKLFFFLLAFPLYSIGQQKLIKKASEHYSNLNYSLALSDYQKLVNSHPKSEDYRLRLAHCYRMNSNQENAYKTLYEFNKLALFSNAKNYQYYADVCFSTLRYNEAEKILDQMAEYFPNDSLSLRWTNNPISGIIRKGWKGSFEVSLSTLSSRFTDFGAYPTPSAEVVFVSSRGTQIINRRWAGNGDKFLDYFLMKTNGEIKELNRSNTKFHEGPLAYHPSKPWVYFTRNNVSKGKERTDKNGIQNLKLYIANIQADGSWKNIRELKLNSNEFSMGHPTISLDGKYFIFSSDKFGGYGGVDLYIGTIDEQGEIQNVKNLGSQINTVGNEVFPWLKNNDVLYFASNGHPGLGGLDLFVSKLGTELQAHNVVNLGDPINTNNDDFALVFTEGTKGYFSSNRKGMGGDDIYEFTELIPFKFNPVLFANLEESDSGIKIPNHPILVFNSNGELLDTIYTNSTGNFEFDLEPFQAYTFQSIDSKFETKTWNYTSTEDEKQELELSLAAPPILTLIASVSDKKTKNPIDGVKIVIKNLTTGQTLYNGVTANLGIINTQINNLTTNQLLNLEVGISKEGYLDKTVELKRTVSTSETINLHELIDLSIGKVEIGANLAEIMEVNPIYFDLGKFNIRTDAALELDKIVSIMNEYPAMIIELGSHTDCRGTKNANKTLSNDRAKASADYIKSRITNPERISGVGYGEGKLKVNCPCEGTVKSNCPEEEHAKNRRTEFIVKKVK